VSYFAWYFRRASGIIVAALSATITLYIHRVEQFHYSHSSIVYWNAAVWLTFYIFVALIICELRSLYEQERHSSHTDSLTRIANRRAFFELLATEANRASRYGAPLTLAYLDIDHFKQINDRFGHDKGDELLRLVAQVMESRLRKADRVARLGGDEFAVLLPETTAQSAAAVLRKLHSMLDESMRQRKLPVTFSVGAVTFHSPPQSMQEMISKADEAMYAAKNSGRDRVIVRDGAV
jgi:diguanylate cyclase (GGDEF)-like protein